MGPAFPFSHINVPWSGLRCMIRPYASVSSTIAWCFSAAVGGFDFINRRCRSMFFRSCRSSFRFCFLRLFLLMPPFGPWGGGWPCMLPELSQVCFVLVMSSAILGSASSSSTVSNSHSRWFSSAPSGSGSSSLAIFLDHPRSLISVLRNMILWSSVIFLLHCRGISSTVVPEWSDRRFVLPVQFPSFSRGKRSESSTGVNRASCSI